MRAQAHPNRLQGFFGVIKYFFDLKFSKKIILLQFQKNYREYFIFFAEVSVF